MKLTILVAEDDPNTRAALAEVLSAEGYHVSLASNGTEARSMFDRHQPDLACLDVMMPGLSGYDLCRHFRSANPRMPILFITAKAEEIDKVVGLELGADDYIVKPFGAKEVLARIRAVARRCLVDFEPPSESPQELAETFWMHDLQVVPRELRARRGDQLFELTLRELRILGFLASRPGEVCGRDELFRIAWEENHIPNSRTLDQTNRQLRKKTEQDVKRPQIIQTVYGVGYRYEEAKA
jgi:DNA-binding response OmpR family regulator